jgi:Trk K+ transport system NAD-binding subunit
MMDPNLKLATMLIIVALGTVGTTTVTAFADTDDDEEDDEDSAIETADEAVHAIFGLGSEEDVLIHQGLCAGGISTEALGEAGCEAVPPIVGDDEEDDSEN